MNKNKISPPSGPSHQGGNAAAHSVPILELQELDKFYHPGLFKRRQAVKRLSMSFHGQSCTGLLGHNGAGKTTSIKLILGLISPDHGQVLFKGRPIARRDRASIGYMPEINKLPRSLKVREILEHQLRIFRPELSGVDREFRIDTMLRKVGLAHHRDSKISEMSKGLGQRVAWAQASIHSPDLLILDEPFTGLDPIGRMELHQWIHDEKNRGVAIILCTHELWSVRSLCDDFHILRKGELAFSTVHRDRFGVAVPGAASRTAFYTLHISGTEQKSLEAIVHEKRLPLWQSYRQDGGLAMIGFARYPDAAVWLEQCVSKGLVVVRFGGDDSMEDDQLLSYFRQDPEAP